MSRADLLDENASIVVVVANAVSAAGPAALMAEILKSKDAYELRHLFGVTTLDVVRRHSSERAAGCSRKRAPFQ
ncbi:malate dehydrogenase-like [Drosophila guanche]|uniref:malate dehydrogenase-like n=1 Tax=Drosophila guanche TaxID=7266 RepID=UPI0014717978|nr:malate dehydrogenase-like [Drosophila guanche]